MDAKGIQSILRPHEVEVALAEEVTVSPDHTRMGADMEKMIRIRVAQYIGLLVLACCMAGDAAPRNQPDPYLVVRVDLDADLR